MKPAIGDDGDVVVRWDGLKHGYGQSHVVLVFGVSLTEDERVMEEDYLAVDVLHKDPERLGHSVNLLIPPEVRRDGEVDAKDGTGDRLDLCLHPTKLSEASQTPHFHNHLRELR